MPTHGDRGQCRLRGEQQERRCDGGNCNSTGKPGAHCACAAELLPLGRLELRHSRCPPGHPLRTRRQPAKAWTQGQPPVNAAERSYRAPVFNLADSRQAIRAFAPCSQEVRSAHGFRPFQAPEQKGTATYRPCSFHRTGCFHRRSHDFLSLTFSGRIFAAWLVLPGESRSERGLRFSTTPASLKHRLYRWLHHRTRPLWGAGRHDGEMRQ